MYDKLFSLIKKPLLWERSTEPFWDDSFISDQMLKAHLNPDMDAASRRIEVIEQSVKWLSSLIKQSGKILDLGCGPGLYTKRFSEMGYDVTGVDLSKRSIDYAKETDSTTNYICKDYLTLDEDVQYDAITMIYCDYAALTKNERKKLLSKVYQMLKPDGIFIFDVFTVRSYSQKTEHTNWYSCDTDGFWSGEPHICLEATYLYESNTVSANEYIIITKDSIKRYIIWDTAYTKQSLTDEIHASGFTVKSFFGDVCGHEYDENSDTLCCIAVKNK